VLLLLLQGLLLLLLGLLLLLLGLLLLLRRGLRLGLGLGLGRRRGFPFSSKEEVFDAAEQGQSGSSSRGSSRSSSRGSSRGRGSRGGFSFGALFFFSVFFLCAQEAPAAECRGARLFRDHHRNSLGRRGQEDKVSRRRFFLLFVVVVAAVVFGPPVRASGPVGAVAAVEAAFVVAQVRSGSGRGACDI
jgi:hypothetical protein